MNLYKCVTCDGTGEVHSHNPKCFDCDGTGKAVEVVVRSCWIQQTAPHVRRIAELRGTPFNETVEVERMLDERLIKGSP